MGVYSVVMSSQIADTERRLRSRNFEIEVLETRVRHGEV